MQYQQDQTQSQNSYIPTTNINTTNANKVCKNLSYIICFNYIKIDHYIDKCIELKTDVTDK